MTGERIAAETARLLDNAAERGENERRAGARGCICLSGTGDDAIMRAADEVERDVGGFTVKTIANH